MREDWPVESLADGGVRGRDGVTERAPLVVGADGMWSLVARSVGAEAYVDRPSTSAMHYGYWADMPVDGVEFFLRPGRVAIRFPTSDGLTVVVVSVPIAEAPAYRADLTSAYDADVRAILGDVGARVGRVRGRAELPAFARRATGPGWALLGDAGMHRDPITADGMSSALCHAELLAAAIVDGELGRFEAERDAMSMPLLELTCELARIDPSPELQAMIGSLVGRQDAIDAFFGVIEGTVPVSALAPSSAS